MTLLKPMPWCLFVCFAASSIAVAQPDDAPLKDPERLIEVQPKSSEDVNIDKRIKNIFSKIYGIKEVKVQVESGVVTLTGDVANETFARDAKDIAIRTAGVVTVED